MVPARWVIVVERSPFFSGMPMLELGETRIVSAPRVRRTRPFAPVVILSPTASEEPAVSAAFCTAVVAIQTSPDDLLTCHVPPCADSWADAAVFKARHDKRQIAASAVRCWSANMEALAPESLGP